MRKSNISGQGPVIPDRMCTLEELVDILTMILIKRHPDFKEVRFNTLKPVVIKKN